MMYMTCIFVNPKADGFLEIVIWWGRFGQPTLTSLFQPQTSSKWYHSTNFDFFNFLVFVVLLWRHQGCMIATVRKYTFRNFEFFKIQIFLLKTVKNLKITQNFNFCTIPMCFRGVTSEKPQNIEIFEKLFLRKNFFWDASA